MVSIIEQKLEQKTLLKALQSALDQRDFKSRHILILRADLLLM